MQQSMMEATLPERVFRIGDETTFRDCSLEVFRYQALHNPVYRDYLASLGCKPATITRIEDIPFLPIGFFRSHRVISGTNQSSIYFESSGTTGSQRARHYVCDPELYKQSFRKGFNRIFGSPSRHCILALLPAYLDRRHSSLVYMMDCLIRASGHPDSGFYLDELKELSEILGKRNADAVPTILLGVSFALLDLAAAHPQPLGDHIHIVETGGMKGRRRELVREELHLILGKAFEKDTLMSEYGMTELLSQAWSREKGLFSCPPWMRVLIRDPNDPLSLVPEGRSGGINIIDLANIHSCAFIATEDLGRCFKNGDFEVLGRFDQAATRGCNLLVAG